MALNNNALPNLSRFSIGEIVDLSGVPDFYNAGSSTWLRSATFTPASNLSTTTKTNLAAAGTATAENVVVQGSLSSSYTARGAYAVYPIARIPANNVSVVPAYYSGTYNVGVGVVNSSGFQFVDTGQTANTVNDLNYGTNGFVASNGTTIFSYCFSNSTTLTASSTTNGTTWTAGTVTGIPTFSASTDATYAHSSTTSTTNYTVAGTRGYKRNFASQFSYLQFAVFWCGARFLLIGPGPASYVMSLSTDGLAWGGDNTNAVLGSVDRARTLGMQFYRNGNNCFLNVGTLYRYSTDGGITWATSTFASSGSVNPASYYLQTNTTDPAKIVISLGQETFFSADSGATWSTNRGIGGLSSTQGGFWYKGSTVVVSDNSTGYRVSTDNGVTYTTPTFPIGTLGTRISFFADANRFYAGIVGQTQLLTSSDAVTWTIVTLTQNFAITASGTNAGFGIVAFDSNTVMLIGVNNESGGNQAIFTLDGGVTWTCSQFASSNGSLWQTGSAFTTPDGGGIGFLWGGEAYGSASMTNVFKTDLTAGGAFYRTGSAVIAPVRTNAKAYVRVG
jgi:hypothetical protein